MDARRCQGGVILSQQDLNHTIEAQPTIEEGFALGNTIVFFNLDIDVYIQWIITSF